MFQTLSLFHGSEVLIVLADKLIAENRLKMQSLWKNISDLDSGFLSLCIIPRCTHVAGWCHPSPCCAVPEGRFSPHTGSGLPDGRGHGQITQNDSPYRRYAESFFSFRMRRAIPFGLYLGHPWTDFSHFFNLEYHLVYSIGLVLQIFSHCHCEKYYSSGNSNSKYKKTTPRIGDTGSRFSISN